MNLKYFLSLFCIATVLCSCQDEDFGFTADQIRYNGEFAKQVGSIDQNQDFNLATRSSITVTTATDSDIKIFMKSGSSWSLVADYKHVLGTRQLEFDVIKGTKEVCVTDGKQAICSPLGSSAVFSGTRAGVWDCEGDNYRISLNEGSEYSYYYYDLSVKNEIAEKLPEDQRNRDMTIQNFTMVSNGPFVVYPLYWYCRAISYIGIYWQDESGNLVEKNLFGNHNLNESVQMLDSAGFWNSDLRYGDWGLKSNASYKDGPYEVGATGFAVSSAKQFRSKGIVVDLPKGTVFGFYIDPRFFGRYVPYNHKYIKTNYPDLLPADYGQFRNFYSDAERNPLDCIGTPDSVYADTTMYCFATYFDKRGDLVVCGEDGIGGYSFNGGTTCYTPYDNTRRIYDYNDIAFKIYGATPEVLSNAAAEWILPFEDLGSSFDLDYNDVILKMSYVNGSEEAYITPIAAGGTLHSEVFFNDTDNEDNAQDLGEIHVLLGAKELPDEELYTPINAYKRGKSGKTKKVKVHDPEHFSIAAAQSDANGTTGYNPTKNLIGVYIKTHSTNGVSTVAYEGVGKTPAMLVLPVTYEKDNAYYEWAWPTENTDIRTAYGVEGHSFAEWIKDHSKATDWYMYPNGNTVEEKSVTDYVNTIITSPEYEMSLYGTCISLPSRNEEGFYIFDSRLFDDLSSATITVVLKGIDSNYLYPYDGANLSEPTGIWSRLNYQGTYTVMGNNSCGEGIGSSSFEGVYQIALSHEEVEQIRAKGSWAVSCMPENSILYMAITE